MTKSNLTVLLFFAICLWRCAEQPPTNATADAQNSHSIERGKYLVEIMGCNDCHTPKIMTPQGPAPDPARLLSGYPAADTLPVIADKNILKDWALFNMSLTVGVGPWGVTFAANLTPDESGLGNWSLEQFKKALREGKAKGLDGGRMLRPPMPWQNYKNLSDDDAAAIFAYLKSIPAVKNVVPAPY
ncbi:MAG: c-type cytochrome [Saprospiraceae bacterium]|nr:c-type cytochrome [Saprospiraceae bacterium]